MADKELLESIGKRINNRRKYLSLTQEQIAERMGVSVQMISNLELGKKAIRPENLVKICSILDISSDFILTGNNNEDDRDDLARKINLLSTIDYKMIEMLVDYCLNNHKKIV